MGKYKFIDAIFQNALFPISFFIPDKEEIDKLKIGDYIQIGIFTEGNETKTYLEVTKELDEEGKICNKPAVERLWFEIINIYQDYYTARLRNHPVVLDLTYDTLLKMEKKHILKLEFMED